MEKLADSPLSEISRHIVWFVIAAALLTALIVVGGIYFWQSAQNQKEKEILQQEITGLKKKLEEIPVIKEEEKQPLSQSPIGKEDRYLRLLSPNGDKNFCIGTNAEIKWESKGVRTIMLSLRNPFGTYSAIEGLPASYSETGEEGKGLFLWKVPETLTGSAREGAGYLLEIKSTDNGAPVSDSSDSIFSIIRCEG